MNLFLAVPDVKFFNDVYFRVATNVEAYCLSRGYSIVFDSEEKLKGEQKIKYEYNMRLNF